LPAREGEMVTVVIIGDVGGCAEQLAAAVGPG
jgi:hypothetical protein